MVEDAHSLRFYFFVSSCLRVRFLLSAGIRCLVLGLLLAGTGGRAAPTESRLATAASLDESLALEATAAMRRAATRLAAMQGADGAWAGQATVTSLALVALLNLPPAVAFVPEPAAVKRGLDYLHQQLARPPAVARPGTDTRTAEGAPADYPVLATAVGALALIRAGRPEDQEVLRVVRTRLLAAQITSDGPETGGFPPAPGRAADPAVTAAALETLFLTGPLDRLAAPSRPDAARAADLAALAARRYLQRCCQTGGAPAAHGVLGLMYARTAAADPRLLNALITLSVRLEERGPGDDLCAGGGYAALLATVKACRVWERSVPGGAGRLPPGWRATATRLLLERQDGDGAWRGAAGSAGWENRPELATALALATLELATR
jgi:hypothetical protein